MSAQPVYPHINPFEPTDADLLLYAQYLSAIAEGCDIHAPIGSPLCLWDAIGRLRWANREMQRLIIRRIEREQAEKDQRAQMDLELRDEPREPSYTGYDRETGISCSGPL